MVLVDWDKDLFIAGVLIGIFLGMVILYVLVSWLNDNPKQGNSHG